MARRSNGGIIGQYVRPSGTSAGGVFSATEAAVYTAAGQFPTGTVANTAPPLVEQIGAVVKPAITSVAYCDNNFQEVSTGANAGILAGTVLRIRGQNFFSNTRIYVNGNIVNTTNKYVNSTEIRTANISLAAGAYTLMAFNTSNVGSIYTPGVQFRPVPVWITNPTLAGENAGTDFSYTLSASDVTTLTYTSSSLPTGTSLSTTGVFSGNISTNGVYSFSVTVTNIYGLTARRTFSLTINPTYPVNYLVVAGGGGGGSANGGGGGGGGGVLNGLFSTRPGSVYTITVGGGGGPATRTNAGLSGSSSNVTSPNPGFTTITTTGGGGGGGGDTAAPGNDGKTGGSGGGGGSVGPASGVLGAGTPGQGFPGGNGLWGNVPADFRVGGGGGGASQAGTNAVATPGTLGTGAGRGGNGYTWPFTGATYGGGGGGGNFFGATGAAGGTGGGGAGGGFTNPVTQIGTAGTPGLGGGGGGGGGGSSAGTSAGGSGTVIIAVPNAAYPTVSAPGAAVSTPPAAPGMTVLRYTAASPATPSTFTFTS